MWLKRTWSSVVFCFFVNPKVCCCHSVQHTSHWKFKKFIYAVKSATSTHALVTQQLLEKTAHRPKRWSHRREESSATCASNVIMRTPQAALRCMRLAKIHYRFLSLKKPLGWKAQPISFPSWSCVSFLSCCTVFICSSVMSSTWWNMNSYL